MTKSTPPNKPPKTSDQPRKAASDKGVLTDEMAQEIAQDVRLTRRRLSFKSFIKWFLLLFILLALLLAGLIAFISTDRGTQYFLNTIRDTTQVELNYDKGNIVSGLWLKDIAVPLDKNSTLYIDKTRVKIGWQQLFNKEIVHLRDAYVHEVTLKDINPPSGRPFDYPHLKMPMRLLLSQAHIERFVYAKATRKDVVIDNIRAKNLDWQNDVLSLKGGSLTLPTIAHINDLKGKVTFQGTYPIQASANVTVPILEKQGFSPLKTTISDSLDTLTLKTTGKWHDDDIQGTLTAYPVLKGLPYKGVFEFDRLNLPYLSNQKVVLSQGALALKGNLKQTALGLDARIVGKDIPQGRYRVSGLTAFKDNIQLKKVTAKTNVGDASLAGKVAWKNGLNVFLAGKLKDIQANRYVPDSAKTYVPFPFTGNIKLAVKQPRGGKDKSSQTPITLDMLLVQNTGNAFDGMITLKDQKFSQVAGQLVAKYMPDVPVGTYDIDLHKQGQQLSVKQLNYRGDAGQFDATARVVLPKDKKPLNWQAKLNHAKLHVKQLVPKSPLVEFVGDVTLSGSADNANKAHRIDIQAIDATALLEQANSQGKVSTRELTLLGQGKTAFQLVNGKLSNLSASYAGNMITAGLPEGQIVFDVAQQKQSQGSSNRLHIKRLMHRSAQGALNAQGYVDTGQGVAWQLSGQLTAFNPALFLPDYKGSLTGQFSTNGVWRDDVHRVNVDNIHLTGQLKNKPLLAKGKLKLDLQSPSQWSGGSVNAIVNTFYADNFLLKWADNHLSATGNNEQVQLKVDVSTLQQLHPRISGRLKGKANFTALTSSAPTGRVNFLANNFRIGSMSVKSGQVLGVLEALGRKPSQFKAKLTGIRVKENAFDSLALVFNGTLAAHRLLFQARHTNADVRGQLVGALDPATMTWQGKLEQGHVASELAREKVVLKQQQPAQLSITPKASIYRVSPHCWKDKQTNGSLCIDKPMSLTDKSGVLHASLKQLDSAFFASFLPDDMTWKGKLQGNAKLNWQHGQAPKINALFYTDNGSIGLKADDPQDDDITLDYNRLSLIVASHAKGLKVRFDAKTGSAGNGYIDAVVDPKHPDKTINGAMVLDDIRLNVLRPFFPGMRMLNGKASLAGGMSGPLRGPQFYGNFKLEDGAVAMLGLPINLTNVNLKSSIRGTQATLSGSFLSGQGKGKLTGQASWKNDLTAKLKLSGKQLAVRYPPTLYAEINPVVSFDIAPTDKELSISGKVDVVKGTVRAPSADPNIIKQSSDIIIIRDAKPTQVSKESLTAKDDILAIDEKQLEAVMKQAIPWRINTNVNVNIVKDTKFSGFGASIPLQGGVRIKQSGRSRTQGFGSIRIGKRLPVNVFGQNLDLTRGSLNFTGNLSKPTLDIEAVRTVRGSLIGVRVKGDTVKPRIEIFNDAGLSNQQAMNALVTGRIEGQTNTSATEFQDSVNNALAAAGLNVGLSGTNRITNRIGRNFGLSALTLGASGSENDTNVNITGYITPDLYLRYGVGVFTPVNKLTMRYQVSRRVYVEASSAIEKAIDIFYNWQF